MAGHCDGQLVMGDAGRGLPGMCEAGGGRPGTTRVKSHNFNLAGTEGPSAWTIVPDSPPSPYPPWHSPS